KSFVKVSKNSLVIFATMFFVFISLSAFSQTKRALLVGIDIYQPVNPQTSESRGGWTNLDGCVNDATVIEQIIISRFGFDKKNISTLHNQEAKRENIIKQLEKLIEVSQKGDVVFVYYAGHGSQVYNSLSSEESGDKQDESIVPADMFDIRDKELSVLFNKLIDKGVILTLIFDSCHSGSIARGNNLPESFKSRHINGSSIDAKDPSVPQKPEDRGALVLSAAQPEQLAKEALDDNGAPHGAFTVALTKALNTSYAGESVEVLFLRIKAIMQAKGSTQEPVLGANSERRKQGLFGNAVDKNSGKTLVAVTSTDGTDNIVLQGGWAIGLNINCELKKSGSSNTEETIMITQVSGMSKSKAKLIKGDINAIKPGDLFEVISWAASNAPDLKVWFPENDFNHADLLKTSENISTISGNKSYTWITDPVKTSPDYIIQYYNGSWIATGPENKVIDLGKNPDAETINKKIPKKSGIFLQLPPSKELIKTLEIGVDSRNNAIDITKNIVDANYILAGSFIDNVIRYAWLKPNISESDTTFIAATPLKTDWILIKKTEDFVTAGQKLTELALKLGKINAWQTISSPPDDGSFPFSLALKNNKTGAYLTAGTVLNGEQYSLVLTTTKEQLKRWMGKSRYVYVFIIDINGTTQQIFPPQNTGNEGNKLPNSRIYNYEEEIPLGQITFTIGPPFGIDSYFLVTSDEAINNFQAFNSEGVVSNKGTRGGFGLDNLLNSVGTGSRGVAQNTTPLNWSVQKLLIRSKEK
ncbi:MAG: caspase family protein, partial [Bacteroidales bacterium]